MVFQSCDSRVFGMAFAEAVSPSLDVGTPKRMVLHVLINLSGRMAAWLV